MILIGRILIGAGAITTFVSLLFSWGSTIYWRLLGEFFQEPVESFYAMPTTTTPEPDKIVVPDLRAKTEGKSPSTIDVIALAIYVLFPLLILLSASSTAIANKGYVGILMVSAIYLISVFYMTFFAEPNSPSSPIVRLGPAHTLLWFSSGACLIGSGICIFGRRSR